MKKSLAALGLTGMLALSPKANAETTQKTEETKKDLIEAITTEQSTPQENGNTITFQEAQKLQEQQQLFEEIMKDEKIQELINKYGQEEVEQIINKVITDENTEEVIERSLKDKNIQKALEEGDRAGVEKGVQRIAQKTYHGTFWGKVGESTLLMAWGALVWSLARRKD